jgi:hypothetical protein
MPAMATSAQQVQELFLAVFGRPVGPISLPQYAKLLEISPNGPTDVLASLAGTSEYLGALGGKTPAQLVDLVYQNLFGRHAEAAGSQHWSGIIAAGTDIAHVVPLVAASASGADLLAYQSRTAAALALHNEINTLSEAQMFDTDTGHATAKSYVAFVHDQKSLATATTPYALAAVTADIEAARPWSRPEAVDAQIQWTSIAYFGRPSDKLGFDFWASALDGDPANPNIGTMMSAFANAAEYQAMYPQSTNAQKIASMYQHLFSRSGDAAGIAYWDGMLANGTVQLSNIVAYMAAGAQGNDAVAFNGKVAVAETFTHMLDEPREWQAYSTPAAMQAVSNYIAGVKDAATAEAASRPEAIQALIDGFSGPARLVGISDNDASFLLG